MSAFKSIKRGLSEAAAHAKSKQAGVNEYQPYAVDVADLRRGIDARAVRRPLRVLR